MDDPSRWKKAHANESEKALQHPIAKRVMAELLDNLANNYGVPPDGLARYGLSKVASYVAQIARAQALGFDPELLRMSPEECTEHQRRIIQAFEEAGKPVWIAEPMDPPSKN